MLGCTNPAWVGDGYCDDITNNMACNYDGGDCCGDNVNTQYCSECQCIGNGTTVNSGTTTNLTPTTSVTTTSSSSTTPSTTATTNSSITESSTNTTYSVTTAMTTTTTTIHQGEWK